MIRLPWGWSDARVAVDLARWRLRPGEGWEPHSHEFHELFWIEHGNLQHEVDGVRSVVSAGQLVWTQPEQVHVGTAAAAAPVIFVNLAVPRAVVAELRRRCHRQRDGWLWDPRRPACHRLPPEALRTLGRLVGTCDPHSPADRDLLLLHLTHALRTPADVDLAALPDRIQAAVHALDADDAWGEGVSGLARRAGCSREHLTRTVRAHLGVDTTTLLQQVRLGAAARLLRLDDRPVAEVAQQVGFASLGHFYKLFTATFGTPPQTWRRNCRHGGPGGIALRTPTR